jgi:ADP-ribose pyrophosphatase YjhB (NUDIX family)
MPSVDPGPLPQAEFEAIYLRVPRLTVELVIISSEGVLLTLRIHGPCAGLWHLPGGTVRYGETLREAVGRVSRDELGQKVEIHELLGHLEYPSHLARGIDWPVGIAFSCKLKSSGGGDVLEPPGGAKWFVDLPEKIHDEQRDFLIAHKLAR